MKELLIYLFGPEEILPLNYLPPLITSVCTFLTASLAALVAIITISKTRKTAREKNALEFELFCQTNPSFIANWDKVKKIIMPMINDDLVIDEDVRTTILAPYLDVYFRNSRKGYKKEVQSSSTELSLIPDKEIKDKYDSILYILNSWERCANAIRHKVYDEEFIYSAQGTTLVMTYKALLPLIECRKDKNKRAFLNVEWLATKWDLKHTIRGSLNKRTKKTLRAINEAKTEIKNNNTFGGHKLKLRYYFRKLKKYQKPSF
ncbi:MULTISPECIES: DUF4760 domain-containing protein [Klebsiella/Raoultella group]|uniref:DUF4760 domain-containing protein n=1 Tax=Klebsiella/Raoultella group TaxID=2890311 RepID=UPI001F327F7F|nr:MULTISPECIES: DUF4760 domain-containing protein [Klebsiella/Raoultella group]EKG1878681.1 DUF4760 domain-containing protein [Salmonella enterica]MCF6709907.1 DUF4760 domain-containing protein [Raoultella ornithinolytica]